MSGPNYVNLFNGTVDAESDAALWWEGGFGVAFVDIDPGNGDSEVIFTWTPASTAISPGDGSAFPISDVYIATGGGKKAFPFQLPAGKINAHADPGTGDPPQFQVLICKVER